jgi:acyl carrier protein
VPAGLPHLAVLASGGPGAHGSAWALLVLVAIEGSRNVASVKERVIDIVAEQLGVDKDKITLETSFVNDLGADSLDTVELVMELEEEFDINIPDDAAEKIQTVGQAVEYIESTQS